MSASLRTGGHGRKYVIKANPYQNPAAGNIVVINGQPIRECRIWRTENGREQKRTDGNPGGDQA